MNPVQIRQYAVFALIIGAVLLTVIIGLSLSDSGGRPPQRREELLQDFRRFGSDIDPEQVWLTQAGADLRSLREDNESLRVDLRRLDDRLQELLLEKENSGAGMAAGNEPDGRNLLPADSSPALSEMAGTFLPVVDEPAPLPDVVAPAPPITTGTKTEPTAGLSFPRFPSPRENSAVNARAEAGVLALDVLSPDGEDELPSMKHYLPAGSFVRVILMTGLDAPTGGGVRSNPLPVLLSLADDGTLPNRFHHRVRDCLVTAAGYGDLAAERAYLRLERMSCVLKNGDVVDLELHGYVVGEDGKAGLRGRVISKQGTLIARSLLAGIAGGLGEGVAQSYATLNTSALGSVQTVEGADLAQFGLARGAGRALERMAQWYLDRADEIYPIIEVDSGRVTEMVLTRGLDLGADLLRLARAPGE